MSNVAQEKTVLVVDDNPNGRELVRTVLEKLGYQVHEAPDGRAGMEAAGRLRPDLIVLDLHMPGLTGFEVIALLRQSDDFAATPVLALTASAMMGDRERALAAGFTGYVTKPIRLADLRSEVERLLA